MLRKSFLFIFLLGIFCKIVSGQYTDSGQDPMGIHWHQVNTEHFQILFPEGHEEQAQYIANILDYIYTKAQSTLKASPKKTSVILHTRSVVSNAMVFWAPKRMDFYSCPDQDAYAQEWLEQLAVHEFRHVIQLEKINQGISKLAYYLFGEHITALFTGLFVPQWFLEGDAVCTETAFSKSGRGRLPSFEMPFRAQLLEGKKNIYDKAVFGSYKEYVPNHYIFGYHMVAQARKKHGAEIWDNGMNSVAKYPFLVKPLSVGLKKHSNRTLEELYNENMDSLFNSWEKQAKTIKISEYKKCNRDNKDYSNYHYPYYINDSTYISYKTSIDDISKIIRINKKGKEKKLLTLAYINREALSYNKGLICWSEKKLDPRWQNQSYSIIKTYDIQTGKMKQLSKKSRYFSPALSFDNTKIAAVEVDLSSKSFLIIMDAINGTIIKRIEINSDEFLMTPCWHTDNSIIAIIMNSNGKRLIHYDMKEFQYKYLSDYTHIAISDPVAWKDFILFTGAFSGIDNLYALNTITKEIFMVNSSKYGSGQASISPDNKKVIYQNYTSNGYDIVEAEIKPENWIPLKEIVDNSIQLHKELSKQEPDYNTNEIPTTIHEVRKYRKWQHLINPHSMAPAYININNEEIRPGFSVMSQNKLSTAVISAGYDYDMNRKDGRYFLEFDYKGWYPEISFEADYALRRDKYYENEQFLFDYSYNEINTSVATNIPLRYTHNNSIRGVNPRIQYILRKQYNIKNEITKFSNNESQIVNYSFLAYNQVLSSSKDMYSPFAQVIEINYANNPFTDIGSSAIFSTNLNLFIPGIFKHHGIKIYCGYQQKGGEKNFRDIVSYPRGYYYQNNNWLRSIKANYKFPFLYPDYRIGSLMYLKRFKAALFFDYAEGTYQNTNTYYRSAGIEITSDMHIIRLLTPYEIGVRSIYLPTENKMTFELLFSINYGEI